MRMRFIMLVVAAAMLGAPAAALSSKAQHRLAKLTWEVYTYSADGTRYRSPMCHNLGYFLGSPLRFDYGHALFQFKPNLFTYSTRTSLIGKVEGERVYQVVQQIHPNTKEAAHEVIMMKRLVVERHVNHFCMIFQEQGPAGQSGEITRVKPATFEASARGPVLRTDDPLNGRGGDHVDASWVFLRGVPVPLSLPNNLIEQLVKPIVPASCGLSPGDTIGSTALTYRANLWRQTDDTDRPTCGSAVLKLSVSQHKIVLASKKYVP